MKALVFLFLMIVAGAGAQNLRLANAEDISLLPGYQAAQEKLNTLSSKWEKEIAARFNELSLLTQQIETGRNVLSKELIAEKTKELEEKFVTVKKLQAQKFGPGGELFQVRNKLLQALGKTKD